MYILQIVVCPFVLFLLAIVLYVLLRFTDSDYPLGIFRLVLLNKLISVFLEINTMDVTSGAWTAYPSGAPKFTPGFSWVCVTRSLVLYVYFVDRCLSFCPFLLAIVLSVLLRFTDSDYPFGIFKLFLCQVSGIAVIIMI